MEQQLLDLRQEMLAASGGFIEAQQAYLAAADPPAKQSEEVLKLAAENCLQAAKPYEEALLKFEQYLLAAEPSDQIAEELGHVEQFLDALGRETKAISKLAAHHAKAAQ